MKLNLDFNKTEEETILPIEQEIIQYIEKQEEKDYEKIFEQDNRLEVVLALTSIRKNLLNWYPFKQNSSCLEIGGNFGEITSLLCDTCQRVVSIEKSKAKAQAMAKRLQKKENLEIIVGELENIPMDEKFDYVIMTGILGYAPYYIKGENCFEELIQYAQSLLKPDGKILLATDNKFGIQYWNGKKDLDGSKEYRGLSQKKKKNQCQLLGERQIRNLLSNLELNYKLYYMFPDYKMPNLIYDENHKISKEDISRNFSCHAQDEIINFYENQVLNRIVKEDSKIFNFFANSFLIEIAKQPIQNDIQYVTFTNYRKKEYRIITIIKENEVTKKAANEFSKQHIKQMGENLEHLKSYDVNLLENNKNEEIVSQYIREYERLDLILENAKTIEELKQLFAPYVELLYQNAMNYEEIDLNKTKELIKNYDIYKLEKMKFLKYGFLDLIPKNCFDMKGRLGVFDQEWLESYIPVEYILYRAIKNSNLVENFSEEIYDIYHLSEYVDLFEQLEEEFRKRIIDEVMLYQVFNRKVMTQAEVLSTWNHEKNLRGIAEYELTKAKEEIRILKEEKILALEKELEKQKAENAYMKNSKSWKITEPLRNMKKGINRKDKI